MKATPKSDGTVDLKFSQTDLNKLTTAMALAVFILHNTKDAASLQNESAGDAATALLRLTDCIRDQIPNESVGSSESPADRPDEEDMADAAPHPMATSSCPATRTTV